MDGVVLNDEACLFQSHSFKATDQTASTDAHSLELILTAACDSLC